MCRLSHPNKKLAADMVESVTSRKGSDQKPKSAAYFKILKPIIYGIDCTFYKTIALYIGNDFYPAKPVAIQSSGAGLSPIAD
jgi:hypothetical protein